MANSFHPTSFTATSTFATLASYLTSAGYTGITSQSVTGQNGYIRNRDAALNLYVGFGATPPSSYETVGPLSAITFNAGMNVNEIWVASASSTVSVGYADGSGGYVPPVTTGVIGTITATENFLPRADADGNLVDSAVSDDGTTVTIDEELLVTGDATFEGEIIGEASITSSSVSAGVGYADGAGDAVTQGTNRTTAVTINAMCGTITLISAAGSTTAASFTVTNSSSAVADRIILNQVSGTDKYDLAVTAVADGSFQITSRTYSGTTTETPVFGFAIIKGSIT